MSKILTKRQKTIEVQRKVKHYIKNVLEPDMIKFIGKELGSKNYKDSFYNEENNDFYEMIIDNYIK